MLARTLIASAALLLFVSAPSSARQAAGTLDGVWKITEVVTTGDGAGTNSTPQPSLIIFARGHYSYISIGSDKPRARVASPKDPAKLTDAEKIARYEQWNPFTANAGTYQVKGSTLTRKALTAKNEAVIGTEFVADFKLEGNTLWLVTKSAAGAPASETRTKLTRVQ
jgi:hypothetical protein